MGGNFCVELSSLYSDFWLVEASVWNIYESLQRILMIWFLKHLFLLFPFLVGNCKSCCWALCVKFPVSYVYLLSPRRSILCIYNWFLCGNIQSGRWKMGPISQLRRLYGKILFMCKAWLALAVFRRQLQTCLLQENYSCFCNRGNLNFEFCNWIIKKGSEIYFPVAELLYMLIKEE